MDETSFMPKTDRRKVVAVKGSKNVWRKETKATFHLTIVAAVSTAGRAIAPFLIVPGKQVDKKGMLQLSIDGATVTGAPKEFSNKLVFVDWLHFFSKQIEDVQKPVVLIVDNSSTHISLDAADTCVKFGILLVALPANATHLFQPLDVAVFKPYKDCVHDMLLSRLCATSLALISKGEAFRIACVAYRRTLIGAPYSAVNGFRTCGIWPLGLPKLRARLELYGSGGVKGAAGPADWLSRAPEIVDELRMEILALPPAATSGSKRKRTTVDVAGRLVTKEQLLSGSVE